MTKPIMDNWAILGRKIFSGVNTLSNSCPRKNRAGKKVFLPHSLRQHRPARKGKTSGFKKSPPCACGQVTPQFMPYGLGSIYRRPCVATPPHSATLRYASFRLSLSATLAPLTTARASSSSRLGKHCATHFAHQLHRPHLDLYPNQV